MNDIISVPIIAEVEQSFLDYSLSVITDRAIPAVEDGLKPVMRRILWSMYEGGYRSNKQHIKCARAVGDCMGRYHPHGDSSIYGALINASQPWNFRYPLIDLHGNNGSRDGDGPAAMRYTECRLTKISESSIENIKKNSVDWIPNFDETTQEPVYLPGLFPNLLCNGTTGIAVAVACSFAPHNLIEIMNAAKAYLINPEIKITELLEYVSGPDFPTGGIVINQKELINAYLTGKGKARIRGEYIIETNKNKSESIVFISIPYKVSKDDLKIEIDTLCEEKKIDGIVEIRDESNKDGVRFVIELEKGFSADVVASQLYAQTDLETTYNYNQVALVDKTPKQLNFLELIKYYVEHQKDVQKRIDEYDEKQLADRIHILDGLTFAIANIDDIVKDIKASSSKKEAKIVLMQKYPLDEVQVDAILAMTLSRLANIESLAIQEEKEEKEKQRAIILERLNNESIFVEYLIEKFTNFSNTYGDKRRTTITNVETTKEEKEISQIKPEDVAVIITQSGNIKRIPIKNFKTQKRNGKGIKTQDDITMNTILTNTIDVLLAFTNKGRVYRIGVDEIPEGTAASRGVNIKTLTDMINQERVVAITSAVRVSKQNDEYVWFITKNGLIKKSNLSEYTGSKRKTGMQALSLRDNDALINVWIGKNSDILMLTENGMSIRFDGSTISATGKTSSGVIGMKLNDDDNVAIGLPINNNDIVFIGYTNGAGKRCSEKDFVRQNRSGKGLKVTGPDKITIGCTHTNEEDTLFISGDVTSICVKAKDIPLGNRTSGSVKVIKDNHLVTAVLVKA